MTKTIQIKRGLAANWASTNPVLAAGEWGLESDTGKTKLGDGTTAWNSLPYKDVDLSGKQDVSEKGLANGYAGLDANAKVAVGNLPDATTTAKGIVQGATDAEVIDGTDTSKFVTPKQLKDSLPSSSGGNLSESGLSGDVGLAASTLPSSASDGDYEIVPEIGMFRFYAASEDPVDGETCIAPASGSGRWILVVPAEAQTLAWIHDEAAFAARELKKTADDLSNNIQEVNTAIPVILTATADLDFPSIATLSTSSLTVIVPGAIPGDNVTASPATLASGLAFDAYVSATDTVTIRVTNVTAAAINPASTQWIVKVIKS
jgi:hypothetical protein